MDRNISEESFYQYSDEIVVAWNRLPITLECHKKDSLDFPFIVSNLLRMSHLKAYILTLEKMLLILHSEYRAS